MSDPLRVVQIITTLGRGGAQATVIESALGDTPGVTVCVLAGPDDPGEGTWWQETAALDVRTVVVPRLHRSLRPLDDVRAFLWLRRWLRHEAPDVVHTHSSKAGIIGRLAARSLGLPIVHTVHGWSFAGCRRPLTRRGVLVLERLMARITDRLVVVTPADRDTGLCARVGAAEQYSVVRSGIDLSIPLDGLRERDRNRGALGLDGHLVVGTVARLATQKRLDILLDAFAASGLAQDGAVLVLVGDGPQRSALEARCARLGLGSAVRFLGSRADAANLVASFDIFALSSEWEGLPRALIEAMAAGVPVIATPVGGVTEVVVDGRTGLIVPTTEVEPLAAALRRLADAPELRGTLSAGAAANLDEFSADRMRRSLHELWGAVGRPRIGQVIAAHGAT